MNASSDGGAERVEITYDPVNPDTAIVGHRTTGWLVFGAAIIVLTGSVLLAGVAFAVVALAI